MKVARPLILTLSTLALLVSACSQTPLSQTPDTLTPQFGSATDDGANQLAAGESGVYLGGTWKNKSSLIKFSRSGSIPWIRSVDGPVVEVALDSTGSAYVLFSSAEEKAPYFLRKYTQTGTFVWQRQLTNPSGVSFYDYASDVDAQNNVYLTFASSEKTELRKYRSDGTLLYSKQIAEVITDLAVVPDGTTYTVSRKQHLTRYTAQGAQVWQKTLPFIATRVAVGTSSQVYVAGQPVFDENSENRVLLARYSSSGAKYWQRTVQQGFFAYLRALDADTKGNVFVGVNYKDDPRGNRDVYFHSYGAAGTRLAQRIFDFGYDDSLADVGALSATEVYVGGATYSSGELDVGLEGFLVRLNGLTGSVTWQR